MDTCPRNTEIPAIGGMMGGYLALPETPAKAAVLMQVELWGMTLHMKEVADRLSKEGYVAIACDLFRGAPAPVSTDPVEKWGRTFEAFDDVRCTLDCRCALDWALSGEGGFDVDKVFAWGFCMGGRFAHNLGAFDKRLAGVINFYGRINFPRLPTKPFLPIELTGMIECPYFGAFAETDGLIPPQDIARLKADLAHSPFSEIKVFPGTEHAFFNDHREAFHPQAASEAWTDVLRFLETHG